MKITFLGTADVRPHVEAYVSATMIEWVTESICWMRGHP